MTAESQATRMADSSEPTPLIADRETPAGDDRSTLFDFRHKVFQVEGSYFAPSRDSGDILFQVPMGDIRGAIPLDVLRDEFDIDPASRDGELLSIIERSLRFVKIIRPNDSIPREILDGTASWSVRPEHLETAKGRLSVQLASWLAGSETLIVDVAQLRAFAEDPSTKEKVQLAFAQIADKLGLGRDNKQQVVDSIDMLARELSYIEALRERVGLTRSIVLKIDTMIQVYRSDRGMIENLERMKILIRPPVQGLEALVAEVDAQTSEVLAVLKNRDAQVDFIRRQRDELHSRLMPWDEMIPAWEEHILVRSPASENLLKETYRFLAHNFPQTKPWKLGGF